MKGIGIPGALWIALQGCLSPGTIETTSRQNETNIANYSDNVAAISAALRREVRLHAQLELHRIRETVSGTLIGLYTKLTGVTDPDSPLLSDTSRPWFGPQKEAIDALKQRVALVAGNDDALALLAAENPVLIDVAVERPGYTLPRLFRDAVTLNQINVQISDEKNAGVRRVLHARRAALLDPYLAVQQGVETYQEYLEALDNFLGAVADQGKIARMHAQGFVVFSRAQPAYETVTGALGDEELRDGVLGLVEKKKGKAYADRVRGRLAQADDVFRIVDGLR